MGFLNLDLYLVDLFHDFINDIKADDNCRMIDEVFADRPEAYREMIKAYLRSMNITRDLRDRAQDERNIYILPSYPLRDLAFPQIAIHLAEENAADWFLGGMGGEDPVEINEPDFVGWGIQNGCHASVKYQADIICNTPEESIWLARLCQRALFGNVLQMEEQGLLEMTVGMADIQLHPEHFPGIVFGRGVFVSGKAEHTWLKRVPSSNYQTGNNNGLEG